MQYKANSPEEYITLLPEERQAVISELRQGILENLPGGFEERMSYGMLGYVVPHTRYPAGYHCDPKLPLPFINLASQKNYVALYHSGIYASEQLLAWFKEEYPKHSSKKLDMGKSCIRFKAMDAIPYDLVAQLCRRMTVEQWIALYEKSIKK